MKLRASGAILSLAYLLAACVSARPTTDSLCKPGAYRSPDGQIVAVTRRGLDFRYTFLDGRRGDPAAPDSSLRCAGHAVSFAQADGRRETWPLLALRITPTSFTSDGIILRGMLLEPLAMGNERGPLLIFVHGSERTGALEALNYPYLMAAQGISAFVYDKRGTGLSEGAYTQNFPQLARDVVAASREAKRLAAGRYNRFGLFGGSQGGWVAPLAAKESGAEFLAIGFGLVLSPLEEDAEQVASELKSHGYDAATLAKARKITDATGALMASHFQSGYELLALVKKRYAQEPWFSKIKGEFTGDLLKASEAELRAEGREKHDNLQIDWSSDPITVLRGLSIPQLWVLAGKDREAPPELTLARLKKLQQEGRPLQIALFPETDHGMYEFIESPDGNRKYTRVTEGYFRLLSDFALGKSSQPYGAARFIQ